ncbi:hypothetical protein CROQUDRAFT_133724 [Cronartium quercuum f. sp. fusiforme G11]|uniref:Uncharacterized protein n=1 Tax=Cronartium quercuum f. sp. fusiforme G11 TaxID=708437 RepID=A0A9P6NG62_9BASI|nr:hypothetical protein CROQUDRAFT_133724 [Cronartium quercuum f. sp. fusiforme G11]
MTDTQYIDPLLRRESDRSTLGTPGLRHLDQDLYNQVIINQIPTTPRPSWRELPTFHLERHQFSIDQTPHILRRHLHYYPEVGGQHLGQVYHRDSSVPYTQPCTPSILDHRTQLNSQTPLISEEERARAVHDLYWTEVPPPYMRDIPPSYKKAV